MARRLRGLDLGQDRYKRRYWQLLHAGGVYVESSESSEQHFNDVMPTPALEKSDVKQLVEPAPSKSPPKSHKVESVKDEVLTPSYVEPAVKTETSAYDVTNANHKNASDVTPVMNGHTDDTHIKQLLKEHIVAKKQQPAEEKTESCEVLPTKQPAPEAAKSPKNSASSSSIFDGPLFSPFTTADTKPTTTPATNSAMFSFPATANSTDAAPPSPAGSDSSASSETSELSAISLRQNGSRSSPAPDTTLKKLAQSSLFQKNDTGSQEKPATASVDADKANAKLPAKGDAPAVDHPEAATAEKLQPTSTSDLSKSLNAFMSSLDSHTTTSVTSSSSVAAAVTSEAAAAAGLCTTVNIVKSPKMSEEKTGSARGDKPPVSSADAASISSMNILPSLPLNCSTPSALNAMSQLASLSQTSSPFSMPLSTFGSPSVSNPLDTALYSKCSTQELSLMYALNVRRRLPRAHVPDTC